MELGPVEVEQDGGYVVTDSLRAHVQHLARISSVRYPVLIQGPTSAGKTAMVAHLARITGHPCVRINNHEHTDVQEYLGQVWPPLPLLSLSSS